MSDAEIIATFMEPKPPGDEVRRKWWRAILPDGRLRVNNPVEPKPLTLDALHEVEAKLKRELIAGASEYRWWEYGKTLFAATDGDCWHASAEQKIKALAAVLRPVVEGE